MSYPLSDHYDGKRFHNPDKGETKSLFTVLKWKLTSKVTEWPKNVANKIAEKLPEVKANEVSVTSINHATNLIQFKNFRAITDPVFSERVSPFTWIGPKRVRPPSMDISELPKLDVVFISHNHFDHMDSQSIATLEKNHHPLFIVPLGNAKLIKDMGASNVVELDWWQSHKVSNTEITLTLVPAQHWSRRSLFDTNESLWGGIVIEQGPVKIYFAGDTGYGSFFKDIFKRLGPMSVSILPIGAYEPRWFMKESHMNPEDAVMAHLDLQSPLSIGTHFGTFQLTDEGIDDPAKDLAKAREKLNVSEKDFRAPEHGETIIFSFK